MKEFAAVQKARLGMVLDLLESNRYQGKVPGTDLHNNLIFTYAKWCCGWGWVHGRDELARINARIASRQFGPINPAPNEVIPNEAIAWAAARVELQGKWNRDLDQSVNDLVVKALQEGWSNKQLQAQLRMVFPVFSKHRLENIARTETMSAYNAGRMKQFAASSLIAAYQFSAILDARTTDICKARNGKILVASAITDAELAYNTPPLHYMCRSVLIPIDKYALEDLVNGDEATLEDFFGWVEDGPRNIQEATDWRGMPAPLPGFGVGNTTPVPPVKAKPATPAPSPVPSPVPVPVDEEFPLLREVMDAKATGSTEIDGYIAAGKVLRVKIQADYAEAANAYTIVYDKAAAAREAVDEHTREMQRNALHHPTVAKIQTRISEVLAAGRLGTPEEKDKSVQEALALHSELDKARDKILAKLEKERKRLVKVAEQAKKAREVALDRKYRIGLHAMDYLKQVRDFGPVDGKLVKSGVSFKSTVNAPNQKRFGEGLPYLPRNWINAIGMDSQNTPLSLAYKRTGRAYFNEFSQHIQMDGAPSTTLHETGHWLEKVSWSQPGGLAQLGIDYRERRTAGEVSTSMRSITGDRGYKPHEVTKPDRFRSPYMGKSYALGRNSEIISMGLEGIFFNVCDNWKDEEYTDFMLGLLATYAF